ncbi:MAG: hypothetical protein HKN73_20260 [Gemmatimonadetes bacterium]|nr:hypothetical protein [Gemmatimonadota bacterium]
MTSPRALFGLVAVWMTTTTPLVGQVSGTVVEARRAFEELDYGRAVELAEDALEDQLSPEERVEAYEVLGYSLGIMDEADRAVTTLTQLIVLDPDREPDTQALPPRLVSLYNQAFGQVLVVRRILVDSTSFVSGEGRVTMHWEVSRPSTARLRLVGNGIDTVIDSMLVNPGPIRYDWDAQVAGAPVPAGDYQLIVTAAEGRSEYQRSAEFGVAHSAVDTVAHISSIDGFEKQPETEIPPRDWRPLGMATLMTGAAAGAALALNNSAFDGARIELGVGAAMAIGSGLALSLRRPDARPVPLAIQLNQLIDRSIADRNQQIAEANAERRRRVLLTVVQELR